MDESLKRKIAEQIAVDMDMDGDEADILYCLPASETAITTIAAYSRAEALEEAAKVVEQCWKWPVRRPMEHLPAAIRALKDKPNQTEREDG